MLSDRGGVDEILEKGETLLSEQAMSLPKLPCEKLVLCMCLAIVMGELGCDLHPVYAPGSRVQGFRPSVFTSSYGFP